MTPERKTEILEQVVYRSSWRSLYSVRLAETEPMSAMLIVTTRVGVEVARIKLVATDIDDLHEQATRNLADHPDCGGWLKDSESSRAWYYSPERNLWACV